jgi:hypothetical protein
MLVQPNNEITILFKSFYAQFFFFFVNFLLYNLIFSVPLFFFHCRKEIPSPALKNDEYVIILNLSHQYLQLLNCDQI